MRSGVIKQPGLLFVLGGLTGGLIGRHRGSTVWGVALGALGGAVGDYMRERLHRVEEREERPAASVEASEASMEEVASYLCQHLGPEVTAYLSGLNEPDTVQAWAQGDAQPPAEEASRLNVAYKAAQCLVKVCGDEMTQTWFFGTNRSLRDTAPAYVLRHWNRQDRASVLSAAQQFAEI